jgi:hypothetical protein
MNDYIESIQKALSDSKQFFSNANKQDRELWVLHEFLSYLPIDIVASDIVPAPKEPNDVIYGHYGFQVKEVLSEGRKRGDEYSDKLDAITEETQPEDLLEPYSPIHIPLSDVMSRVASDLARHRVEKYERPGKPTNAGNIDVLVYLNLSSTTYTSQQVTDIQDEFNNWKSVSLVSNNCAVVLACSDHCNQLLAPHERTLFVKKHVKN